MVYCMSTSDGVIIEHNARVTMVIVMEKEMVEQWRGVTIMQYLFIVQIFF